MKKDWYGWLSVFFILTAYTSLTFDILKSEDFVYNLLNLVGGIGLAFRVWEDKNIPNFVMELIFITIAVMAIYRNL